MDFTLNSLEQSRFELEQVRGNLRTVRNRIKRACLRVGRDPSEVKLLLATKTVPVSKIKIALEEGEAMIGENKVQEALGKHIELKSHTAQWHMIGHLQSNKVKAALQFADLIESVDRMSLAGKLQSGCEYEDRTIDIFIQVNTSYEQSKFGVPPEEAISFIKQVASFDRLNIKGLMTIGLFSANHDQVRKCFNLLKTIRHKARQLDLSQRDFRELSMGMSGDMEIAIEEGATIVRVGTAIFGKREYPDTFYWNEKS